MHRYGQKLERRLAAVVLAPRRPSDPCQAGDDLDARGEAATAMIQSELFESIISLQEAGDEEMDPADRVDCWRQGKNIATLSALQRHADEVPGRG
ncbi:DUF3486 family protein [Pseudomonas aeruginosa]|nr:DUF3486 family protein [Pseudomonas aeruginosa]